MSSSPPHKQPSKEPSNKADSPDTTPSGIQPEALEDKSTAKAPENIQEAKSNRRNPLTWWRNKSNDSDGDPFSEDTPAAPTMPPTQESPSKKTPSKTTLSTTMTEIKLFCPLDTVGTENYLRYGVEGPRHYVMGLIESVPTPEAVNIQLKIVGAESILKFSIDNIQIKRLSHEPQHRTVWGIYHPTLHTQIIWIWDFFRMLSSIQLRVEIPPQSALEESQWTKLANTLQTLTSSDQLIIRVQNNVGTITQTYYIKP